MAEIILYDSPSRFGTGTTWSPNVWKTRLLLNFKGVEYRTKWLKGQDIEPTFKSFGIPPHEPGTAVVDYTIPTVRMPEGSYIMDSKAIAKALESLQPQPPIYLASPILEKVENAYLAAVKPLIPVLVPRGPRECIAESSVEYFRQAREKNYGMPLEEYEARFGGEAAWEKATPALHDLANLIAADSSGPYCMGATPSYADFVVVAFLEWCRCLRGGIYERVVGIDPAFDDLYRACRPWLERNDH